MKKVKRKNPQKTRPKAWKKSLVSTKTVIFASWQTHRRFMVNLNYLFSCYSALVFCFFVQNALIFSSIFLELCWGKFKLPWHHLYRSLRLVKKHNIFVKYTQKQPWNFYIPRQKIFLPFIVNKHAKSLYQRRNHFLKLELPLFYK